MTTGGSGHGSAGRAAAAMAFRAMRSEWDRLAESRRYRHRLEQWAVAGEPALGFADGHALVRAGRSGDQRTACAVLEALARRAQAGDELALRSALQVLLPRLCAIADRHRRPGLDVEERAGLVLSAASEEVLRCRPGTARTPFDFRLWSNIGKRVGRRVAAHTRESERLVLTDATVLARSVAAEDVHPSLDLPELVAWAAERAGLDRATAELIVLTRVGGLAVHELAQPGRSPDAVRKRRARAEARLRQALLPGAEPGSGPVPDHGAGVPTEELGRCA